MLTVQIAKLLQGVELRFVSDEGAPEAVVDCAGCLAPCCRMTDVPLSLEEAQRLPHFFGTARLPGGTVDLVNVALLARHPTSGACVFARSSGLCDIWVQRPKACRVFDCKGTRCAS